MKTTGSVPVRTDAEDHLLTVLGMVNDWLKFAEAKNAGLIALGGLSLAAALSFAGQVDNFPEWSPPLLIGGCALWVASICLAVYSFRPETGVVKPRLPLKDQIAEDDNLYYFANLAGFSPELLLSALSDTTNDDNPRYRFESGLAHQVVINSRITLRKLELFTLSMYWWEGGLFVVGAGVLTVLLGG